MRAVVRKNFVFDQSVVEHLKEIASSIKISLTKMVQKLIEERYVQIEQKKKIEAFSATEFLARSVFKKLKSVCMYRKIFLDANILVDSTDAQRSGHLFKPVATL